MSVDLEKISVKEFFTKVVPDLFKEGIKQADTSGISGTEFSLQFNITGGAGGVYSLRIKDGKNLEVIEGGLDKPNIAIELGEPEWREAITGKIPGIMDQMLNPNQVASRDKLESAKGLSGVFQLTLSRAGKPDYNVKMIFNGASSPFASLKMSAEDFFKMAKKEVDGPSLFMTGKMSFEGDMAFLLQLQGFVG